MQRVNAVLLILKSSLSCFTMFHSSDKMKKKSLIACENSCPLLPFKGCVFTTTIVLVNTPEGVLFTDSVKRLNFTRYIKFH